MSTSERFRLDERDRRRHRRRPRHRPRCAEAWPRRAPASSSSNATRRPAPRAAPRSPPRATTAELLVGDVTDAARMTGIADELAARGTPATILVNNAGIGESGIAGRGCHRRRLAAHDGRQRQRRLLVLRAPSAATCSTRGAASIVNLGSMSGTICQPAAAADAPTTSPRPRSTT